MKKLREFINESLVNESSNSELGRVKHFLANSNKAELKKYFETNNIKYNQNIIKSLKNIYKEINSTVDPWDYKYIVYDDIEWDDWKNDYLKNTEDKNNLDVFMDIWKYANKGFDD